MGARLAIPVEEYLSTSFDGPDREYVEGEVVERAIGGPSQSDAQAQLTHLFRQASKQHGWWAVVELRLRLKPRVFRIPDVCVFFGGRPDGEIISNAPNVVVEVLSPDDRHQEVMRKLGEYREFGVLHIWLIDPQAKRLSVFDEAGLRDVETLVLPERGFRLTAAEIFESFNA